MEELRDDVLNRIVSHIQGFIRGYQARKEFAKLQEQRYVEWSVRVEYFDIRVAGSNPTGDNELKILSGLLQVCVSSVIEEGADIHEYQSA